jgi:CAAX protease family protein
VSIPVPPRPDLDTPAVPGPGVSGRVRSTWGWWEGVGVYFLAFLAGGIATLPIIAIFGDTMVGGAAGPTEILATIVADVVITAVLVLWLSRRHKEWRAAMAFPGRDRAPRDLLFGLVAGAILVPAVGLVAGALTEFLHEVVGHRVSTPEQIAPGLSVGGAVMLVVLACVVAPITEEFFFRGVLFRTVRDRHGFWAAALASAIPFGLSHYVPSPWIDALLLQLTMVATGIGLAWVYERRGTIVSSMAAHMAFNVIGVITILAVIR